MKKRSRVTEKPISSKYIFCPSIHSNRAIEHCILKCTGCTTYNNLPEEIKLEVMERAKKHGEVNLNKGELKMEKTTKTTAVAAPKTTKNEFGSRIGSQEDKLDQVVLKDKITAAEAVMEKTGLTMARVRAYLRIHGVKSARTVKSKDAGDVAKVKESTVKLVDKKPENIPTVRARDSKGHFVKSSSSAGSAK